MKKNKEAWHQMPKWISNLARKLLDSDRIDVDPTAGQSVVKTKICAHAGDRTMQVTYDCTD